MHMHHESLQADAEPDESKFIHYVIRGVRNGEDVEIPCDSPEHQADLFAELTVTEPQGNWSAEEVEEDVEV